ncbi:hypothetical protein OG384_35915 [Streptomyces sp. NBC_01324]|uniref:hypothetical protein n=1 Tax=Streptomyces sp. NBC_01324 TaxID=2903826 RepID=UPI002E1683A4|nr:hypothetical protein OG384_35915 [Streptomyces sp. NBC_01324]
MSLPPLGREPGAVHHEHCRSSRCCRCQQRPWATVVGFERLCGLCASCCQECGRAPARHVDGLDHGLCGDCRGLCNRCRTPLTPDGDCQCRKWQRPGADPVGYLLHVLPQPLMREFGGQYPAELVEMIHRELGRRSPDQLLDRVERRWNARWAHTLQEKDEDGGRRWPPLEIAGHLLGSAFCEDPQCEDGRLIHTDAACPRCGLAPHRFVPAQADRRATSERARSTAAEIRRELLDRRTGARRGAGGQRRGGGGSGNIARP